MVNGDRAEVIGLRGSALEVQMEDGRKVTLNTKVYDALDHGYCISVHSSQGASVEKSTLILDRASSAELFFVGASRSKGSLDIMYSQESFEDVNAIDLLKKAQGKE